MKTITLPTYSPHRPLLEHALRFIALLLFCFALLPRAQALGPDTDGAIPGSNNGEGIGVLVSRTTGIWNTGTGFEALNHLTAGNQNTATGLRALFSDISGGYNTATGVYSLFSNTSGFFNSATGAYSLANNTDGSNNTANGYGELYFNTEGELNTATGFAALYQNTTGSSNTATGSQALQRNTEGDGNTANGVEALHSNTTGNGNTATGARALVNNTTGLNNTANGFRVLFSNTMGSLNTATGIEALFSNTTGGANTAVGFQALFDNTNGIGNTAIGESALSISTGNGNIALGSGAGVNLTTGGFNIDIGNAGVAAESNTIRIGDASQTATYIAGISGEAAFGGDAVLVTASGKLGTVNISSQRFKDEIKPMDKASEAILALKPVTFRYKKEIDPQGTPQFGLVAEEVDKVSPDLVKRDARGEVYTVRYEAVNAMLLNEFLKEHRTVQAQKAIVEQLKQDFQSRLAHQQRQIEALTSGLQKVNAQLEVNKFATGRIRGGGPAPQVADNTQ
jgi:hypothetical protein